ncbi:MAG: AAA family ATPase [Candidatus Micrarchaeia archaeon]
MDDNIVRLLIGITGSPGVGKSYFSKEIAKRVNARIVELNDLVKSGGLYSRIDSSGSVVVKLGALGKAVRAEKRRSRQTLLIVGHLLPELSLKLDIVVVLRYDPVKLARRLEKRGYNQHKIRENVIAEALDYCGNKSKERKISKELYEIESSSKRQKAEIILYVEKRSRGLKAQRPVFNEVNSMPALASLAKGARYGI